MFVSIVTMSDPMMWHLYGVGFSIFLVLIESFLTLTSSCVYLPKSVIIRFDYASLFRHWPVGGMIKCVVRSPLKKLL